MRVHGLTTHMTFFHCSFSVNDFGGDYHSTLVFWGRPCIYEVILDVFDMHAIFIITPLDPYALGKCICINAMKYRHNNEQ